MPEDFKKPDAPKHLPESIAAQWTKTYNASLAQSKDDVSQSDSMKRGNALREANKLLRITPPADHDEAMELVEHKAAGRDAGWPLLLHGERKVDGVPHLVLVMADGKKHLYKKPAAKPAAKPAEAPLAGNGK
jgi:hypothetical protein